MEATNYFEEMDNADCSLLLLVLHVLQMELSNIRTNLVLLLQKVERAAICQERSARRIPQRRSFEQLADSLSTVQFRRMFRMQRASFDKLCDAIITKVGKGVFKSEGWLLSHERQHKSVDAALLALGGMVSGEIKLAITLRLLAGASYLDLLAIYGVASKTVYEVFHQCVGWICLTFNFPMAEWIRKKDDKSLNRVAEGFSAATDGVFSPCIGALDGIAIKIKSPTVSELIPDPGNYFCRKGFYALNVQAICDKNRRVLWVSTGHKGSTHDSAAWAETKLCQDLEELADWLVQHGFFLIGDSAYPLLPYFLVPFSDPLPNSPEDAFNFWLSNSRIQIECTFGELVMRWGIFWRKLTFSIEQIGKIINAAMLLHNFLVDEREAEQGLNAEEAAFFRTFSLREQDDRAGFSDEVASAVATDNNEPHPGGRPSNNMVTLQEKGKAKRDDITADLYGKGMTRPMRSNMSYNSQGQVYFNS
jgi:hypothetical protein